MTRESLLRAVWRQNRVLPVLIGILFIGNLLGYFWLSTVAWPRLAGLERDYITLQDQVRSGRQSAQLSPQESLRLARQDWERFQSAVPAREEFPALITELAELASSNDVTVSAISYQPKDLPDGGFLAYSLQFSVVGTYPQTKRFLQDLERTRRLIEIKSLNVSGASGVGHEKVTIALQLVTYFRSEQP